MKLLKSIVLSSMIVFSMNAFANNSKAPVEKEVQIGLNSVYIPSGFDSGSDVFVVVNGIFQNGCYRWNRADVSHLDTYSHEVKSIASVSPGVCIMVLIPFQKEVRLGKFASGKHTLKFDNGDGTYFEKALVIE